MKVITPERPVAARDFYHVLKRFRACAEKRGFLAIRSRSDRVDPFGELGIGSIRHDLITGMDEVLQLFAHRANHFRITMAYIANGDATREINEAPAFYIPDLRIFCRAA